MPVTTSNRTGTTHSTSTQSMNRGGGTSRSSGVGSVKTKSTAKPGYSARSTFEAAPTKAKGVNGQAHISSLTNKGARNQLASGTITVNGKTYSFKSGGAGKGSLPKGTYTVTAHRNSRFDKPSMVKDGVGYSFALSNKYDARVGATRTELRIHPDGGRPGTIGCIGIQGNGATQRAFRNDMNAELKRNGGRYSLNVN
jgi:hypothetical protein